MKKEKYILKICFGFGLSFDFEFVFYEYLLGGGILCKLFFVFFKL